MPVDRRKWMQAAERLLKQGKLQAALTELQRASENAPDDLLTLNRLGDLLARQGRSAEAIGYYRKIANQFQEGGFLPKSVAIHKKILRIDPNNLESLVGLGELYLSQELHGEARNYLLHAANRQIEAQNFDQARAIYEKLVDAEPDEPRHRVRLAETRAAEGDSDGAGEELIGLGRTLLSRGSVAEAERVFNRAAELLPASHGPLLGLTDCLVACGRDDEALTRLEEAANQDPAPAAVLGELAWHYAQIGRSEEALALIRRTEILKIELPSWLKLFSLYVDRGDVEILWTELDPSFEACEKTNPTSLADFFEQIEKVEEQGHLPALERLFRLQLRRGEDQGAVRALESLVGAYKARSMNDEANRALAKLEELAPTSRSPEPAPAVDPAKTVPPRASAPSGKVPVAAPAGRPSDDLPLEAEAPAVPLNRTDDEFVAGRLTQADVLEKYGLKPQALEQVESVTSRFPGHVAGQEKHVALLRTTADGARLAEGLAALAMAYRAAGDNDRAVEAAREASSGDLRQQSLRLLQQCRLIDGDAEPAAGPSAPPVVPTAPETPESDSPVDAAEGTVPGLEQTAVQDALPTEATAPEPTQVSDPDLPGVDLVIDFDADPSSEAPFVEIRDVPVPEPAQAPATTASTVAGAAENPNAPQAPEKPSKATTREPTADMLEEIRECIESGSLDAALQQIEALHALGYAGAALDDLNSRVECAQQGGVAAAFADDDLDLSTLAVALENDEPEVEERVVPEEDPEQSLDEVFSNFKAAVKEQVGEEDHGTHYDLGIAYKEMGLVDESISEFQLAATAPAFQRRASTMIGLCYWERQELESAAEWYRKAIEAADGEGPEVISHLRYDLGEVLLQSGDVAGALGEFREVAGIDPGYREVRTQIRNLEEQLQV